MTISRRARSFFGAASRPASRRNALLAGMLLIGLILCLRSRFELVVVAGESMRPTLRQGGLLILNRHAYATADPRRGDIVVAAHQGDFIVKRVVGLPGEEVEVRMGVLYINGMPFAERHSIVPGPLTIAKGRLLAGRFALLGDNRSTSEVVHAVEPKDKIAGKVIFAFSLPHFA
jgi:signal peptidase I